jgi:hypothetical protein
MITIETSFLLPLFLLGASIVAQAAETPVPRPDVVLP